MNKEKFFRKSLFLFIGLFCISFLSEAQGAWKAGWVSLPARELPDFAIVHARNVLEVEKVPNELIIDLSAVIRYKLYVNGQYLGQGPANNDLKHYSYDQYDIAPHLQEGKNVIGLQVFSLGEMNPIRYHDDGLKMIVRTLKEGFEEKINTGQATWLMAVNPAYTPTYRRQDFQILEYFAMGGGEAIEGSKYPWDWLDADFEANGWKKPNVVNRGLPYGDARANGHADISLSLREIPMMDESEESRPVIRKTDGYWDASMLENWQKAESITFPAYSETTIILDQGYLTKGHTHFLLSGGKDSKVEVGYAENVFNPDRSKSHRDEIEDKVFFGLTDWYFPDGGKDRHFSQLLPRTWRYVEVRIKTDEEPLVWESYAANKFIYPFEEVGSFESPFQLHQDIWDVGWRTSRLCADETYMDCPYYEQLQYIGDTRIQALISLYAAGDDRLMVNSLKQFAHSITDEGIAQSRYPSHLAQMIPPYSLFWVNMLHDYFMHREDPELIRGYLPQVASILFWFENKLREDYILGPMPWWSYTDVTDGWVSSSPPGFQEGGSAVMTLQFLYAIDEALPFFREFGQKHLINHFEELSDKIRKSIYEKTWDASRQLLADTPDKNSFSQHANILGILTSTVPDSAHGELFNRIIAEEDLSKANIYFRFYLTRAAVASGNGDYFIENLETWEKMLAQGLSTFAEHENRTRSDCHAWSASPNFEFLQTVCGIQPKEKYFSKVRVAPNPGTLTNYSGKMPHPKGLIETVYDFDNNTASIILPEGLEGTFEWKGKTFALKAGKNQLTW